MFATGSAALNDRARALLAKVAPVLLRLPEGIGIAGHTDAQPYRGSDRSNWDLSADRAHATRRLLGDAGVPDSRIRAVAGHADRDLLLPADPRAAANRRVAITVLRDLPLRAAATALPGAALSDPATVPAALPSTAAAPGPAPALMPARAAGTPAVPVPAAPPGAPLRARLTPPLEPPLEQPVSPLAAPASVTRLAAPAPGQPDAVQPAAAPRAAVRAPALPLPAVQTPARPAPPPPGR